MAEDTSTNGNKESSVKTKPKKIKTAARTTKIGYY